MKNKLNIIIVILLTLCIGLSLYLLLDTESFIKPNPTITLNRGTIVLKIGDEEILRPTVENLSDYTLEWTSSNNNVAIVIDGKVRAVNKGSSLITVKIKDYDISASLNVIVNEIEPESIKLDTNVLELTVDDTHEFSYTLLPDNVTNKEVRWEVSDNILVNFDNGRLTAIKSGVLSIRVIASNGIKDTCNILIKDKIIPVEDIILEKNSYELKIGDSIKIKPTISPDNATDKTLIWESSDPSIATVSKGTIKAIKQGKIIVTVSDSSKQVIKNINVTISPKSQKIHFIKQSVIKADSGDAILIESDGKFAMVDTGLNTTGDNTFVYNYLKRVGVKELEFILITHCHDDHIGGVVALANSDIKIKGFYIKTYIGKDSNSGTNSKLYSDAINTLNSKGVPITYIDKSFRDGSTIKFGSMNIELYNTPQRMSEKRFLYGNENNNSVMELITVNNYKIFLTGDSYNGSIMEEIINKIGSVDVLKIPHHGYATCSLNPSKAAKLNPSYIIVTNARIDACRKHFNSNIQTYFTKASGEDAVVVDLTNKIKISS